MTIQPMPTTLIGVDFSGARDAGRHLWVSLGTRDGDHVVLHDCRPAEDLPGGGRDLATALGATVNWLRAQGAAAAGFDTSFSLPEEMLDGDDWPTFLAHLPSRHPSPEAWREACRQSSLQHFGRAETLRTTERETRVPFCTWNLRMYRQAYHGLCHLFRPLVLPDAPDCPATVPLPAVAVPEQTPLPGRLWLLEACPASHLKRLGMYQPYKVASDAARDQRQAIFDALCQRGLRLASPALQRRIIDQPRGDALDSVIALMIVRDTLTQDVLAAAQTRHRATTEGQVFA